MKTNAEQGVDGGSYFRRRGFALVSSNLFTNLHRSFIMQYYDDDDYDCGSNVPDTWDDPWDVHDDYGTMGDMMDSSNIFGDF